MARVRVNGDSCMAILDNGAQINTIMPGYIENHSLDVRPLSDLMVGWVTCIGLANALTWPLGYVIIWDQVVGVQGYDEDQILLIIPDLSNFVAWVPMILGTPTTGCVVNVIRGREMDALATPWVNAQVAYLLVVRWASATVEDNKVATKVLDSTEYNEKVTTKDCEMIDAFLSRILYARMKSAFISTKLNVMAQALYADKEPLPQGLTIQDAYTEMCNGSKNVTVLVRNSMAYPQALKKKIPVARVVAAHCVLEPQVRPGTMECVGYGPGHPDTEADHRVKVEKAIWEIILEWITIFTTWSGRFCPASLGWVPQHFLSGALQAWLYSLDWTCD